MEHNGRLKNNFKQRSQNPFPIAQVYIAYLLLHGAESLLMSYMVLQLVKKFPAFLKP